MGKKLAVVGRINNLVIEIELPDDFPVEDLDEVLDKLQQIADSHNSAEEVSKRFESTARKLGLEVWRAH